MSCYRICLRLDGNLSVPGVNNSFGTGFEGHEFYEASSIRKINEKYYFVYSSVLSHELCYAVSDRPNGGFKYGGTIISNADIGYDGRHQDEGVCYFGNNHGGLVELNGVWYIFWHKHTNSTCYSRQGCADKVHIEKDGRIKQVKITSCGLNGKPLKGEGNYPAYIACILYGKEGVCDNNVASHPKFAQYGADGANIAYQYIENLRDESVFGFRYFDLKNEKRLTVTTRGDNGQLHIYNGINEKTIGKITVTKGKDWHCSDSVNITADACTELVFCYKGNGKLDVKSICFDWTSWDYLGESWIGMCVYPEENTEPSKSLYPARTAGCGCFDILGGERPSLAYHRIVWGSKETYIAVEDPSVFEKTPIKTAWAWEKLENSWYYPGYEHKPIFVYAYTAAEEAALYVNGTFAAKVKVGTEKKYVARFATEYVPGEIEVVSLCSGKEVSRQKLVTPKEVSQILLRPDKTVLNADGQSLAFVEVLLADSDGNTVPVSNRVLQAKADGAATLQALGSAVHETEEVYTSGTFTAYRGRLMAVIRAGYEKGEARLSVRAENLQASIVFTVK